MQVGDTVTSCDPRDEGRTFIVRELGVRTTAGICAKLDCVEGPKDGNLPATFEGAYRREAYLTPQRLKELPEGWEFRPSYERPNG